MEINVISLLTNLDVEEAKEVNKVHLKYSLKREEIRKKCNHKFNNGDTALTIAGNPWHSGWDVCQICKTFIETNEYGRE